MEAAAAYTSLIAAHALRPRGRALLTRRQAAGFFPARAPRGSYRPMAEPAPAGTEPAQADAPLAKREDTARSAGRGGLAIAAAKAYFILIGFVQKTLLTRVLGAEGYGAFSSVMAIANVADNMVITSSIQGTSRTVAEAKPDEVAGAQRGTLKLHAALALPIAGIFFLVAPLVGTLSGAPHVAPHLRVASLIVLGYALYTPLVGTLNGRRRFVAQAGLDVTYATMRTALMIGGGVLLARQAMPAMGAIGGFALSALLIVPIAAFVAGIGKKGPGAPPLGAYLWLIAPLAVGQFFLNTLMQSDITLLRWFASQAATGAGLVGAEAAEAADRTVGVYSACQLFAFLPYQLLLSVTFILFPMLAKAHGEGDEEAVRSYVRTGIRLSLILTGAMVAVLCGLGPGLLSLAFRPEIAEPGGRTLRILALGQGAFAVYGITATVLSSLHRERWTMALNFVATLLVAGAAFAIVPGAALGAAMAERTAMATSVALFAAAGIGGLCVKRLTGALVGPLTVVRVLVALGAAAALPMLLPLHGKLVTLAMSAVVGAVYLVVLLVTGELGKADLAMVMRVVGRKKA